MKKGFKKRLGRILAIPLLISAALVVSGCGITNQNKGRIEIKNPYNEDYSEFRISYLADRTSTFDKQIEVITYEGTRVKTVYIYPSNRLEITSISLYTVGSYSTGITKEVVVTTNYTEYMGFGFYPNSNIIPDDVEIMKTF